MTEIMQKTAPEIVQPTMVEHTFINRIRRPVAIALTALGSFGVAGCGGDNFPDSAKPSTTTKASAGETFPTATATTTAETSTTTTTTEVEVCADTWEIKPIERGDSPRWFANGVQAIREVQNAPSEKAREEATEAAHKWFNDVKADPKILAGVLNYFSIGEGMGNMEGVSAADLVDADDPTCASQTADEYAAQFNLFLADPKVVIEPGVAPANGVNSGANSNGDVVRGEHAGVSGTKEERLALHFSFVREDGIACEIWVMERCGQIVVLEDCVPEDIIIGKTDDDILPGDGTPAAQDPGTPDVPGEGPAGQEPGDNGYLPHEPQPPVPPTTAENTAEPTTTTEDITPATTGVQQTAPPAPPTTGGVPPNTGTTPTTPPVG